MCEILTATKLNDKILLGCSECEDDFINARIITIINDNKSVEITHFIIEKSRQCFSDKKTPWVMLSEPVEDVFLKKGSKIIFK